MTIRVLIGKAAGVTSPVKTLVSTLYLDIEAAPGSRIVLPADGDEKAVYGLADALQVDGSPVEPRQLAVLGHDGPSEIVSPHGGRFVVIGGAPMDGRRHIWWNFVSSSRERIEVAKRDWQAQRMGAVPGETEFIPLPER